MSTAAARKVEKERKKKELDAAITASTAAKEAEEN